MEYWVVYDVATGDERWRGSGPPGSAQHQQLPAGLAIVLVPAFTISGAALDLDALRGTIVARIDAAAEAIRLRFLTPGAGQAMTYTRKESEARLWTADNDVATPFLSAEATARGMSIADLASEVITLADAWVTVGSAIEGARMGAKAAVTRATNLGAIVAAGEVDWSTVVAPAA